MALQSIYLSNSEIPVLETQVKFNTDLGKEITWNLTNPYLDTIGLNAFNNRFAPDQAMSIEEHEEAVVEEDVLAFENLKKSWECNPQFEQLIGYTLPDSDKIFLIAGHRRFFAAKRANAERALVWVAANLSQDEIEHIRDWPEIHQTKVAHSSFARYKAIYQDLRGRNELDREKRINSWKQKGYTKQHILKAERVYGRLDSYCEASGEKPHERASQVKAFETYDQICENTFQNLKDVGDFGRLMALDKVAKSFLKHQIAHDDLKVTVEGLSKLSEKDPVFQAIESDEYLDSVDNLRRLTNLARTQNSGGTITDDVSEFTTRIFSKLIDRADAQEIENCVSEFRDIAQRLDAALSNIKKGGGL